MPTTPSPTAAPARITTHSIGPDAVQGPQQSQDGGEDQPEEQAVDRLGTGLDQFRKRDDVREERDRGKDAEAERGEERKVRMRDRLAESASQQEAHENGVECADRLDQPAVDPEDEGHGATAHPRHHVRGADAESSRDAERRVLQDVRWYSGLSSCTRVDAGADMLRIDVRGDPVSQVEDVPGAGSVLGQNPADLGTNGCRGGEQRDRIQVSLKRDPRPDPRARAPRIDRPVEPDRIAAALGDRFEPSAAALGEQHHRHRSRFVPARECARRFGACTRGRTRGTRGW